MPPTDTAALAANDDTQVKTLGEHLDEAAANVSEQPETPADSPATPAESTATHTDPPPAEQQQSVTVEVKAADEAEPAPSAREIELQRQVNQLHERLRAFEHRREKEQQLLADRDSALHAIESAKNQVAAEKRELAEIESEIAALLKTPLPVCFEQTPIGQIIAAQKAEPEAPAATPAPEPVPQPPAWMSFLPEVAPEQVRLLDAAAGDELPTVDAICAALLPAQVMQSEKRTLRINQIVMAYGTPWVVTALWKDDASGACRAHAVPLHSKDSWQQLHEEKFGRAVQDFDQNDESKTRRQVGGEWCGLVVKVGRKVYVVGHAKEALQLAYCPPEAGAAAPEAAPAEQDPTPAPVDAPAGQDAPADAPADAREVVDEDDGHPD
jgi:hypothetical protein